MANLFKMTEMNTPISKRNTKYLLIGLSLWVITIITFGGPSIHIEGNIISRTGINCLDQKFEVLKTPEKFFDYLNASTFKYKCKNLVLIGTNNTKNGNYIDGTKRVCFDEEYKMEKGNCIVLSFGNGGNWLFDDAMDRIGCKVHCFDPTVGKGDYNRSKNVKFYKLGISGKKGYLRNNKAMKVDRYRNILIKLNLLDTEIDYLKMDVEGSEINFFNDVLNDKESDLMQKVKQIGVEIHTDRFNEIKKEELAYSNSSMNKFWNIFKKLECRGFKLVSSDMNTGKRNAYMYENRRRSICYELLFIRNISSL